MTNKARLQLTDLPLDLGHALARVLQRVLMLVKRIAELLDLVPHHILRRVNTLQFVLTLLYLSPDVLFSTVDFLQISETSQVSNLSILFPRKQVFSKNDKFGMKINLGLLSLNRS